MPRPNKGRHLWMHPKTGIFHAREFKNGKAQTVSLRTLDKSEALHRLAIHDLPEKVSKGPDAGCIYVIGWQSDGPVKVGKAQHPVARLGGLQCGCPYKLRLIHHSQTYKANLRTIEAKIHAKLADKRLCGEWFDVSAADAAKAIRAVEWELDVEGLGPDYFKAA